MRVAVVGLLLVLTACEPTPTGAPADAMRDAPTVAASVSTTPPSPVTRSSATPPSEPDGIMTLRGNSRNAIAWAPLSDPDAVTVEGSVPSSRAWSTSKVLVIATYLEAVVGGDPGRVPDRERALIRDALTTSSGEAIAAIKQEIPPSRGAAMTRILRSVGDQSTTAPDSYEGSMQWSVREQVRFMAALGNGRVVSPAASAYLLHEMQPIPSQRWGLGAIGARAFKPGWVSASTETRQMGIVGDYAVAIITAGEGPVTRQSDGDYAHQWQLNRLAALLARRITRE